MPAPLLSLAARQWKAGNWILREDSVGEEVAVSVQCHGFSGRLIEKRIWAWPHGLQDLALGHGLLEMVPSAVRDRVFREHFLVNHCANNRKDKWADKIQHEQIVVRALPAAEGEYAFAVCLEQGEAHRQKPGCCGNGNGEMELGTWSPEHVLAGMESMLASPGQWDGSGCFHRAALCLGGAGRLLCLAEDIGRHNCLDRLTGWLWTHGGDAKRCALFATARITASFYAKARRAGFQFLVSRSAVSSAAVYAAHKEGVTLIGFCRPMEKRLTIFADPVGRVA